MNSTWTRLALGIPLIALFLAHPARASDPEGPRATKQAVHQPVNDSSNRNRLAYVDSSEFKLAYRMTPDEYAHYSRILECLRQEGRFAAIYEFNISPIQMGPPEIIQKRIFTENPDRYTNITKTLRERWEAATKKN